MWQLIKSQWPLLTTADSLVALQAMFRLLVLLSVVLRPHDALDMMDSTPLSGESALFYLLAGVCRVTLLTISPDHQLDGPLSGPVYFAFEVAAVPLLMRLTLIGSADGLFRRTAAATYAVFIAGYVAMHNRLPLSGELYLDSMFTLVELLELLAAASFLVRTAMTCGRPSGGSVRSFTHVALPMQQFFSMYFFMVAFEDSLERVSVGYPLLLMRLVSSIQVGALLFAAILHFIIHAASTEGTTGEVQQTPGQPELFSSELSQIVF